MSKLTLIRLCFWLYLARPVVSGDDLYHKVGGELMLKPDKSTVTGPITSILWKHGKNKVAEWDNDFGGLQIYAAFKERTSLDQTTGELRISGLTKTDSGLYSVEFNSKSLDKTYKLFVIKEVPKPTITSSCNANKTTCTLTCEGNTTDAEPVTYNWKVGEGAWEVLVKHLTVSKNNTGKSTNSYKYFCKMKNSAGEGEVSEPIGEVFGPEPSNIGAVVAWVVFTILVLVAIAGMLVWKKKKENIDDTMREILSKVFCGICGGLNLKVGGELLLKPDKSTVTGPITSILWKHGKNKVAEWEKDSGLYIYSPFHHRTTLYKTTGELKITRLKKTDSGVYSVEFNSIPLKKTYKLSVIWGDDETKTVVSAEPGGDLNAAEKGEVKAEGSMLLNEDRVKYHNDNGEGAAKDYSVLYVRELWTRGRQRIMKTREPTVSSGLPALDDKTF